MPSPRPVIWSRSREEGVVAFQGLRWLTVMSCRRSLYIASIMILEVTFFLVGVVFRCHMYFPNDCIVPFLPRLFMSCRVSPKVRRLSELPNKMLLYKHLYTMVKYGGGNMIKFKMFGLYFAQIMLIKIN